LKAGGFFAPLGGIGWLKIPDVCLAFNDRRSENLEEFEEDGWASDRRISVRPISEFVIERGQTPRPESRKVDSESGDEKRSANRISSASLNKTLSWKVDSLV
jgi:hypothetical protein